MTIRKIMVPVRGDGKGERSLDYALVLAATTGAHVDVVHSRSQPQDMLPFGTLMMTPSMKTSILEAAAANAIDDETRLRRLFDDYCQNHNLLVTDTATPADARITASWREETGTQANVVSMRGRLADLIVVAQPDREANLGVNTLEAALLETGKLVMMVPDVDVGTVGKHVAIAWNGDSRAARTVSLGLSILKNAEKISILSAEKGGADRLSGLELIDYLSWHGIGATLEKFEAAGAGVGAVVLERASQIGADSLMMGGYGHSRRRELIMGGVTQHIIDKAALPIFMAH